MTKATASQPHVKSLSDPAPGTKDVEGLRNIFNNLLAKVEEKRLGGPVPEPFKVARMLLEQQGRLDDKPVLRIPGHPWKGDVSSRSFLAQAPGLPDHENCALWLENIPIEVTHTDIFNVIHTGAVNCLHLNSPDDKHPEQAAKIAFSESSPNSPSITRYPSNIGCLVYLYRQVSNISSLGSEINGHFPKAHIFGRTTLT